MKQVPQILHGQVKEFLDQVSEHLSCNGCNDWDFTDAQLEVAREFIGDPKAMKVDYTVLDVIRKALGL